jgi:hypothetical protein
MMVECGIKKYIFVKIQALNIFFTGVNWLLIRIQKFQGVYYLSRQCREISI